MNKIPVLPFADQQPDPAVDHMQAIWYGHAALYMRMAGLNLLIDPMFGSNAAPVSPIAVKRFSNNTLSIIDELPDIDLVLLTHDHYDHLDYDSILQLQSKCKQFFVALGVGRHLLKWGIPREKIVEFDWWEQHSYGKLLLTFTPTRHFSGRGLRDRAKSLWGGWVLQSDHEKIWFSGDGGYGQHFKEIGKRLGPFDFAFMECGQYNALWHLIHMYPEEAVQAAIDAGAKKIMPVHWAGFSLAQHSWKEPAERFTQAATSQHIPFIVPALGERFTKDTIHHINWWR